MKVIVKGDLFKAKLNSNIMFSLPAACKQVVFHVVACSLAANTSVCVCCVGKGQFMFCRH